jgi:hypothetical protein
MKKRTFEPKLKSFEADLMEEYNIEDKREKAETYVY